MSIDGSDYYPIIRSLQKIATEGNCVKVVRMTAIFDENGRLIAKGEPDVTRLWPKDSVKKLIEGLEK